MSTGEPQPPDAIRQALGLSASRAAAAERSVRDRLRARLGLGGRDRPRPRRRTRSCSRASTTPISGANRVRTSSSIRSAWRGSARACASTRRRCARRSCTTPSRTPRPRSRRCRALRRGDRGDRRRRHEAEGHHLPVARRGAGEQLPQDDGRDGHRRPGHPDQARRPPAQHAHDRGDAQAEADREGSRDARDLRAARPPPGHPRDQVGARGPRLRDAAPAQVPGDQGLVAQQRDERERYVTEAGEYLHAELDEVGIDAADRRARQALLLDLLEDDQEGPRVQRDLRPHGDAGDRRTRSRTATAPSA